MNLLAIDTSTQAQVIGLVANGKHFGRFEMVGRGHSQKLLPAILSMLDEAGISLSDLDGIIYGRGPGSFTGLRISVGVVQGLGFGLDIPVVGVSTLACLAQGVWRQQGASEVVVALIARNHEVYFGSYSIIEGIAVVQGEEGVFDAAKVPPQLFTTCVGIGSGWVFRPELESALGARAVDIVTDDFPRPEDLLLLGVHYFKAGLMGDAMLARPEYLREKVAAAPGETLD